MMRSFARSISSLKQVPTVAELTGSHLLITGQTGSGKTTTTLSLLSQLQQTTGTVIVLDPTGEYARLPNAVVYRLGVNAYLDAGQFSAAELLRIIGLPHSLAQLLNQAMNSLRIKQNLQGTSQIFKKINYPINQYLRQVAQLTDWSSSYPIKLLAQQIIEELVVPFADRRANYDVCGQEYDYQQIRQLWPSLVKLRTQIAQPAFQALFGTGQQDGSLTELNYILRMFLTQPADHQTLVIDLSPLKRYEEVQSTVISILLKHLLNERLRATTDQLPVKIVIDEAHRYLPTSGALKHNGIFQIAREGRKLNLALVITTQSPLDLPSDLRSQFANLIVHHLATPQEWAAFPWAHENNDHLTTGMAVMKCGLNEAVTTRINLPAWWERSRHGIY